MKVVISGYGKMGRMVEKVLAERNLELAGWSEDIASFDRAVAAESVCIDFTTPQAFRQNYRALASMFKAVVVGTTGWNDIEKEVRECFEAEGTTLIYASNFSVGVNIFFAAADFISRKISVAEGYTPYIIEKHHCHKLDAPSGTAKSIAAIVESNLGGAPVDIQSVRAGEIPGIHTLVFEGLNDRLTIEHEAFSRNELAEGAVRAALMTEKTSGVHEFKELLLEL